ncbi:LysM peptidoglycan-binding domain-containing protein [Secundilactobacillus kimchicus]|nr:LysM peptidoglycan-binding domain-containing protein [Secundilactobacillus kimchicus]
MSKQTLLKQTGTAFLNEVEVPVAAYKVADGDSLYGLWIKFRSQTTVGAIMTVNKLTTSELQPGKSLKIPLVL